ncbi:hydrogenobyrinic acid a,c-diamide synthase (glutamine-hydrolysing) /cobyrinate a,c-diamide synthase [Lentzea albidocapillata subsp. violacea]|uniref:Hydrogenobyrinate a,c-diamide synthase n=1 Tax=Lentzea albidocapillata subsp. violacea TaxID=128104 RepID=A0A1G9VLZ2_9PSEU|nr:cobyrinate a,c-diamide synthase [Lentzea albidocapillata]SDM73214.1 hydrogenobyrinic acid a,c-diamide synthase (glutamine-hydrolysing) /cobyrinate a,c-diamide synthase [Lentzea albidocapillata subsp. violacea]
MVTRLVVAAPASGSGKTTVATGLMAALRAAGSRVAPFKVGPDYIDPGYHSLATGRPGRNLDPVMVGEHRIPALFAHGSKGCDIAVVEGVMGLFDGRIDTAGIGSTAHVAKLLNAPVLFVVDARGQSRSLAALLHGFRGYDPTVRLGGVILNQVGSERHEQVLRSACDEVGLDVLGVLPRDPQFSLPSRHLGLVTAAEHGPEAVAAVDAIAAAVAKHVDLDAVRRLASSVPTMAVSGWEPQVERVEDEPVVAIAGGAAFTFGYAEHVEVLRAAGAAVAVVDPLHDEDLPEGTAGLVLPGGFPEQHAEALSANVKLREAVARFARSGAPVHAECGGLLYLARSLDGHPMCGVLDAEGFMTPKLILGYRDAVASTSSPLHPPGSRVTGHEFHRTQLSTPHSIPPAWQWRGVDSRPVAEGFVVGGVHASYLHTHPAGDPEAVARFVRACHPFVAGVADGTVIA